MANQLADSLSPYLIQHQDNPVDWVPWSDAAFATARQRDVPVFLSVGYAACHWCHVMAHESFENDTIGAYLNEHFVCIKVDREERPDIDQIYMNAVQLMTGHGGWPMSVFLDHDGRPFYAGTYWPPVSRGGMPGFTQVLDALVDAWSNRRDEIHSHAGEIHQALAQLAVGTGDPADEVSSPDRVDVAVESLLETVDTTWGGFGSAPKFPHATDLLLFLRVASRTHDRRLLEATERTLDKMAAGGIRDHIGGGFARYAVDGHWLVPHFEKMLYDNALLAEVYIRTYQVTGHQRHAVVAEEILDYLRRDMVDQCGGIHSSEDADSEGVEGKFYVWQVAEVMETLGPERGRVFCDVYDIREGGNFEGASIPNLPMSIEQYAQSHDVDEEELQASLRSDRSKLFAQRQMRVRPGRDDKVITAWNALAIKSFSIVGCVLQRDDFIETALAAAQFVLDAMRDPHGRLLHAYRGGTAHLDAMIDDYALTIDAMVALYEATADSRWVAQAVELADQMRDRFEDTIDGGFYYTPSDGQALITRNKDWHDGSLISGNGAAAAALLKLHELTGSQRFRASAEATLRCGQLVFEKQSRAASALVSALDQFHGAMSQWVIAVSAPHQVRRLRGLALRQFRPNRALAWVVDDEPASLLGPSSPVAAGLIEGKSAGDHDVVVYPCVQFHCEQPVVDPATSFWEA
ncbi:MAG: thioredoxin domain-containing protein [Planctomycetota bacterium]